MRKWALLGLVAVLSLGVSIAFSNPESISWQQWAEHYQVGNRPPKITQGEIRFIEFIPDFGTKTIKALRDNLPITSEAQLRAIAGIGEKQANMLLALYNLESNAAAAISSIEKPGRWVEAIAVGRVIYVVDGDTFYIEYIAGGEELPISIRPYLIKTPEVNRRPPERYGPEAKQYAWQLLFGRTVWLVHYGRLSDNRLLAFVYLDPERLSLFQGMMIAQGFAKMYIHHSEEAPFREQMGRIQDDAQADSRGLWGACR
jgi:endonuclease YncB( thermonuclease family)